MTAHSYPTLAKIETILEIFFNPRDRLLYYFSPAPPISKEYIGLATK